MKVIADYLHKATPAQRSDFAKMVPTSVNYLYQLAGGFRKALRLSTALGIHYASKKMNQRTKGALPVICIEDLAEEQKKAS